MALFFQQLRCLLWRNCLLKIRNKGLLFQELIFPVIFVILLVITKYVAKPDIKPRLSFLPHNVNSTDFGQPFGANAMIYAAPNTSQSEKWMQDIVSQLNGPPQYTMFASAKDAEDAYNKNFKEVKFGVIFNFEGNPFAYAIRTPFSDTPNTKDKFYFEDGECHQNINGTSDNCAVNKYLTSGFVQLQIAIESVLMSNLGVSSSALSMRQISVQMMDLDGFTPDTSYIQIMSPLYFIFSFCILASYVTLNVVAEKEQKIRDGMLMMGLNPNIFWFSWAIIYMVTVLISSAIMFIILEASSFFKQSDMALLFLIFVLYGASFISFAFMISPFFNKARIAGIVVGMSTVFISLFYLIVTETRDVGSYDSNIPVWCQWIMCLLCPFAFAACIDKAVYLDIHKTGLNFDEALTYGKFPVWAPMLMMVVDTVLYAILTIYFDKVIPGDYGVQYSPLFFLKSFKKSSQKKEVELEQLLTSNGNESHTDVEPVSSSMKDRLAMKISSISKSFVADKKVTYAVKNFSLDVYEGHITCLLGHNGAGKTTLVNMLTGIIPPTSGSAKIRGLDITVPEEMVEIRKSFGICTQHNILYDRLSCKEHLRIFAAIKGVPPCDMEDAVRQSLKDVDLEDEGNTFASNLSGGQKRKLSVAIALIGDPKLIVLDEPTSGMDICSRQHLWSLLKRMKEGRIILLTTHFMDEADILSDRKVFIRKGKLSCCGSSLFLKNKFGIGYHLPMVVDPTCDVGKLTLFLTSTIPEIELQHAHGKEVSYTVPLSKASDFPELFTKLDESSSELKVKSYGVSMTTLEEVFLKLEGKEYVDDEISSETDASPKMCDEAFKCDNIESEYTTSFEEDLTTSERELQKQQFLILLWIRFLNVIHNKKVLFVQIFLPVSLVLSGLMVVKLGDIKMESGPSALPIHIEYYVNSSMRIPGITLPGLLVFDSWNTTESQETISLWKQRYTVDSYFTEAANQSNTGFHFVGMQLNEMTGKLLTDFLVYYKHTALHSVPAAISLVTQTLLNASGVPAFINVNSFPWPQMEHKVTLSKSTIIACILVGMAFTLILPGFSAEVVRDHEVRLRSQLRISGVGFSAYWGSIYLINFIIYLIPSLLIIITIMALQIPGLSSGGAIGSVILLLLFSIPSLCFLALVVSFFFDKTDNCNTYLPFLLSMAGVVPYMVISSFDMIVKSDDVFAMHYICCIFSPPYVVLGGFHFILRLMLVAGQSGKDIENSAYFDMNNHILGTVLIPIAHSFAMFGLLRVLDLTQMGRKARDAFPCFSKSANTFAADNNDIKQDEDSDVTEERTRIKSLESNDHEETVAYIKDLRKTFKKRVQKKRCSRSDTKKFKVAVRNLTLGVNKGEVVGLLGPNGAGKTTALNMIIAETNPTFGKVVIGGQDIHSRMLKKASLGYCPQYDALWDVITLREHIICFAIIKGIPLKKAEKLVDLYVSNMKLEDHKLKQAKVLSGGTKRKGNPDFELMDEPSTGMDPQSKRFLWDIISSTFRNTNKGAILTTHYMEEADALCDRVGIMVNGQLNCLGSTQHLKNKFGTGYVLDVKLANNTDIQSLDVSEVDESMNKLEDHLRELFSDLQLIERFMERAQYAIPKENIKSLAATFASLENCKHSHHLEEYSFSQSSLEQIFLHFAKKQVGELEDNTESDDMSKDESSYKMNPQNV